MKKVLLALLVTGMLASCSGVSMGSGKKAEVLTLEDSISYCLGLSVGSFAKEYDVELNQAVLDKAVADLVSGEETYFPEEQVQMVMQMAMQKIMMQMAEKNKATGADFLAQNNADGIVTLESGLQYEILKEGTGPIPVETDKVLCHYTGTLIDGTVFDSSVEKGEPVEFPVTGVIKGWTEALLMMPVGSKWKVYLPSELGYGERPPQGSKIKPNSVLIFEMELLEITTSK